MNPDLSALAFGIVSEVTLAPQGSLGGCVTDRLCADGELFVGVTGQVAGGFYQDSITDVVPFCASVLVDGTGAISLESPRALPSVGVWGPKSGPTFEAKCPPNHAVTAVQVEETAMPIGFNPARNLVRNIQLTCSALTLDGTDTIVAAGMPSVVSGVPITSTLFPPVTCDPGSFSAGGQMHLGEVFEGLGAHCRVLRKK